MSSRIGHGIHGGAAAPAAARCGLPCLLECTSTTVATNTHSPHPSPRPGHSFLLCLLTVHQRAARPWPTARVRSWSAWRSWPRRVPCSTTRRRRQGLTLLPISAQLELFCPPCDQT
jgi:hypothetical protein